MWPLIALAGLNIASSVAGADAQRDAGRDAANAQTAASNASIAEQRRQFDAVQQLLSPYIQGGSEALGGMRDLLGIGGPSDFVGPRAPGDPGPQAAAIAAIERGPEFQALLRQGEEAILANASATGGLRGGNTQAALAQFRPQLLNQLINERFQRLAGVAGMGQASAAGQAAAGIQTGQSIGQAMQTIGAAQAGGVLARGNATAGMWNGIGNAASSFGTLAFLRGGGLGGGLGGGNPSTPGPGYPGGW
jgi:hypothetical protein